MYFVVIAKDIQLLMNEGGYGLIKIKHKIGDKLMDCLMVFQQEIVTNATNASLSSQMVTKKL